MTNLLNLTLPELEVWLQTELGEPKFRAMQIWQWVWQRMVRDFESMTNISKACREKLTAQAAIIWPEVVTVEKSQDDTTKFLLRLEDGALVETVLIPSDSREGVRRWTQCVSSQVGCAVGQVGGGGEEGVEEVGVLEAVDAGAAVGVGGDEAGAAQDREVLGDGGLGEAQVLGELDHAVLPALEMAQDRQARGVPEHVEERGEPGGVGDGAVVVRSVVRAESMWHRHEPMIAVWGDVVSTGRRPWGSTSGCALAQGQEPGLGRGACAGGQRWGGWCRVGRCGPCPCRIPGGPQLQGWGAGAGAGA